MKHRYLCRPIKLVPHATIPNEWTVVLYLDATLSKSASKQLHLVFDVWKGKWVIHQVAIEGVNIWEVISKATKLLMAV